MIFWTFRYANKQEAANVSREEKEDGNSDGTKTDDIRGREFQILKMPPKTRSLAKRARNSFRVRGNSETPAIAVAAVGSAPRRAIAKTRDKLSRNRCVDDTIHAA